MSTFINQKFKFLAFICMVLLVFVHGYNLQDRNIFPFSVVEEPLTFNTFFQYFVANGLLRFCIPLLFIMAGYLFASNDDQPHEERVTKRLHTLLLPYLIWSAIGLLFTWLLQQYEPVKEAVLEALRLKEYKTVDQYTLGNFLWKWIIYPLPFQLWFIRCLLMYIIMYPLLRTALNFRVITFLILIFLWAISFDAVFVEGEGLLFFTLGIWFYKTRYKIEALPGRSTLTAILIAWIMLVALKTWLAFKGNTGSFNPKIILVILHKVTVGLGVIVAWYAVDPFIKGMMKRKWIKWAAAFTFMIYVLHVPLITYATNLIFMYTVHIQHYRILTFILLPVIVILFCILIAAVIRAAAPKVYGLLTGGR